MILPLKQKKRKCEEKKLLPNNTKYVFVCHMPINKNTIHDTQNCKQTADCM